MGQVLEVISPDLEMINVDLIHQWILLLGSITVDLINQLILYLGRIICSARYS